MAVTHIEFDLVRQFDDRLGMMSVLEQRVFQRLGAVDEQAAIEAVLLLGDPLAAPVPADKDDGGRGAARWRFDEFHVGIPSQDERVSLDIFADGYEFERRTAAITSGRHKGAPASVVKGMQIERGLKGDDGGSDQPRDDGCQRTQAELPDAGRRRDVNVPVSG